jgi:hypothetical protein
MKTMNRIDNQWKIPNLNEITTHFKMFFQALYGDIHKSYFLLFSKINKNCNYSDYSQKLRKEGIVIIPEFLSYEECNQIVSKIEDLIGNYSKTTALPNGTIIEFRNEDRTWGFDTDMIDIRRLDKSLKELESIRYNSMIQQIISEAYNRIVSSARFNCYVNNSVNDPRIYHVDNLHYLQVKSFILLTDVPDPSFGCHSYIKKTHKFSFLKYINIIYNLFCETTHKMDMRLYHSKNIVNVIGKRGTLVITDQNGFHRGLPQEKGGKRVMLVNTFAEKGDKRELDEPDE